MRHEQMVFGFDMTVRKPLPKLTRIIRPPALIEFAYANTLADSPMMNRLLQILAFVIIAAAVNARPLDVYFVGNQEKVAALFKEGVEKRDYVFHPATKKDVVPPRLRIPYIITPPRELRVLGKSYKVIAALIIDKNGKVIDVAIVETSEERLSPEVKSGCRRWVFIPTMKEGKAVACCVFAPVEFKIETWDEILGPVAPPKNS